jgi:hypothetical protein
MKRKINWKSTRPPKKRVAYLRMLVVSVILFIGTLALLNPVSTGAATIGTTPYTVNMDWQNQALNVELNFPDHKLTAAAFKISGATCDKFLGVNMQWDLNEYSCANNVITVIDGTIGGPYPATARYKLKFKDMPNTVSFTISELEVYDVSRKIVPAFSVTESLTYTPPSPAPAGSTGGGCFPDWKCSGWSLCNASLQQERTCSDNACFRSTRSEIQSCPVCQESWVCGLWSECSNGQQRRSCVDEHSCLTSLQKPELTRSCTSSVLPKASAPPSKPYVAPPKIQVPLPVAKSFLKDYWIYIAIGAASLLLVVVLVIFLVMHGKKKHYNYDELKDWIVKERAMGTTDKDIKIILHQNTGWKANEIDIMFLELKNEKG